MLSVEGIAVAISVALAAEETSCHSLRRVDGSLGLARLRLESRSGPAEDGLEELHLVRCHRGTEFAERADVIAGVMANHRLAGCGERGLSDGLRGYDLVEVGNLK